MAAALAFSCCADCILDCTLEPAGLLIWRASHGNVAPQGECCECETQLLEGLDLGRVQGVYLIPFVLPGARGRLPNEKNVASRKAELLEVLSQHSIQAEDPNSATTFGYYPPFAPPWLQKHEVIMRVKGTGFGVVKRQE